MLCYIVGGTSVTGALECPATEKRMIVSLDMSQMVCLRFTFILSIQRHVSKIFHLFCCCWGNFKGSAATVLYATSRPFYTELVEDVVFQITIKLQSGFWASYSKGVDDEKGDLQSLSCLVYLWAIVRYGCLKEAAEVG